MHSGWRDPGKNHAPVLCSAHTAREPAPDQAVEQTRNVGVVSQHAARDFTAWYAILASPAQDAENVVLRLGQAVGFEQLLKPLRHEVAGTPNIEDRFLPQVAERLALLQLALELSHLQKLYIIGENCSLVRLGNWTRWRSFSL
jgi:hypothetical protein